MMQQAWASEPMEGALWKKESAKSRARRVPLISLARWCASVRMASSVQSRFLEDIGRRAEVCLLQPSFSLLSRHTTNSVRKVYNKHITGFQHRHLNKTFSRA